MKPRLGMLITVTALLVATAAGTTLLSAQATQPSTPPGPPGAAQAGQGWLGCRLDNLDDDIAQELGLSSPDGVLIVEVMPDTPAKSAGLKDRDVIMKMDDRTIAEVDDLIAKMRTTKPGQAMKVLVMRDKQEKEIAVTLGTRPAAPPTTRRATEPPN